MPTDFMILAASPGRDGPGAAESRRRHDGSLEGYRRRRRELFRRGQSLALDPLAPLAVRRGGRRH